MQQLSRSNAPPAVYTTAGKVEIPRLPQPAHSLSSSPGPKSRVPSACTTCRKRKLKCSGEKPQCTNCRTAKASCVYPEGRRDRLKSATEQNAKIVELLRHLEPRVSKRDRERIKSVLESATDNNSERRQSSIEQASPHSQDGRAGSDMLRDDSRNDHLDIRHEDAVPDIDSETTGFIGDSAVAQWLRKLDRQLNYAGDSGLPGTPSSSKPSDRTYRCESSNSKNAEWTVGFNFSLDNAPAGGDVMVDPNEMPTADTAQRLFACYMDNVQPSFPILPKLIIEDRFQKYLTSLKAGKPHKLAPTLQAILNVVFAISARYSHLVGADWQADERDHLLYEARARFWAKDQSVLMTASSLPHTQIAGVLALYYICVGQISRAWLLTGIAIRHAYALGLHLRNEDPRAPATKKENLTRLWWALHSLECLVCVMTGRPSTVSDAQCSVPLPAPIPEDTLSEETLASKLNSRPATAAGGSLPGSPATKLGPNSGAYFNADVQVCMITRHILSLRNSSLSTLSTFSNRVRQQQLAVQYSKELEDWASSLPIEFDFTQDPLIDTPFISERLMLGLRFHSASLLLTQPSLCILQQSAQHSNVAVDDFGLVQARACVDHAKAVANLLPLHPDTVWLYAHGPWWAAVHYIMQAVTVLLISMTISRAGRERDTETEEYTSKLICWLQAMQGDNAIANQAYQMSLRMFERITSHVTANLLDSFEEHDRKMSNVQASATGDPLPDRWAATRFPGQDLSAFYGHNGQDEGYATAFDDTSSMWGFHEWMPKTQFAGNMLHNAFLDGPSFVDGSGGQYPSSINSLDPLSLRPLKQPCYTDLSFSEYT